MAEVADFLAADRTSPYAWQSGRSRPTRRALAGLALFGLTGGDKAKLVASSIAKKDMVLAVSNWLKDAGYPSNDANEVLDGFLKESSLIQPAGEPTILSNFPYKADPIEKMRSFDSKLKMSVKGLTDAARWRFLVNRLSQEEATERFAEWQRSCYQARIANMVTDTFKDIEKDWEHGIWFMRDILTSAKGCQACSQFITPLDVPSRQDVQRLIADMSAEAKKHALPLDRCSIFIRVKPPEPRHPAGAVWAFYQETKSKCIGRLLTPETELDHDLLMLSEGVDHEHEARLFGDITPHRFPLRCR